MKVFEGKQDYVEELEQHINQFHLSQETLSQLSNSIVVADVDNQQKSNQATGLNLKIGKFILRNRDLPVLEGIGMVAAGITLTLTPAALAAPAAISGFAAFAKLIWSTWRNSAKLSQSEIMVLGLLQIHGPLSEEDLIKQAIAAFPDITAKTVSQTLMSLTDVEQLDGDIVELIRKDASGRWRTRTDV